MTKPIDMPLDDPFADLPSGMEIVDVDALVMDPENARKHTEANLNTLEASIKEVGLWRSIAIDENNRILAGNATVEVAGQLGIGKVKIVEADGNEIVAVRRRGLTEDQKRRYGLFDNRSAEFAEWNAEVLKQMYDEGTNFDAIFSTNALAEIFAQASLPLEELARKDETAPPLPSDPITKPGDVYLLGRHLLMCGDCRNPSDVEKLLGDERGAVSLVFTDPPYNVAYVGKTKDKLVIENDQMNSDDFNQFLRDTFSMMWSVMAEGAVYYCCHPGGPISETFYRTLRESNLPVRQQIIWAKNSMVLGHSDFHYKHEPLAYGWKEGPHFSCGDRTLTTVWEIDRPGASREHPTMKPLELVHRAITYSSRPDDVVYDPFGGSGTTLLAAEPLGRRCRMMELDPAYCDVIVDRWRAIYDGEVKVVNMADPAMAAD